MTIWKHLAMRGGLDWHDIIRISDRQPDILVGRKRRSEFWEERDRKTQRVRGEEDGDQSDRGEGDHKDKERDRTPSETVARGRSSRGGE